MQRQGKTTDHIVSLVKNLGNRVRELGAVAGSVVTEEGLQAAGVQCALVFQESF